MTDADKKEMLQALNIGLSSIESEEGDDHSESEFIKNVIDKLERGLYD